MTESSWPQVLEPVAGPYPIARVRGVVEGMGDHGPATVSLIESGVLPPDLMTGLTLYLLACQPRKPRPASATVKGAPGVSGRIWVRERSTFRRPVALSDPFVVEGLSIGRHVRKGRRYGTTESTTRDSRGRPVSSNLTTGLLAYRVDADLEDRVEGQPLEDMKTPEPDWSVAANNPHLDRLAAAKTGCVFGNDSLVVTLAMMTARDTDNPINPIHSDPEIARAAGLRRPIAGGSHIQAFALDLLMAEWGPQVLLHGSLLDTRWKAPIEADAEITRRAEVVGVHPDRVEIDLEVRVAGGPVAMAGAVVIPRPA